MTLLLLLIHSPSNRLINLYVPAPTVPLTFLFFSLITRIRTITISSTSICNIRKEVQGASMGKPSGSRDHWSKLFTPLTSPFRFSSQPFTILNTFFGHALLYPDLSYLSSPCPAMSCHVLQYSEFDLSSLLYSSRSVEEHTGRGGMGIGEGAGLGMGRLRS